jgi:hypothetical protein
MVHKIRGGANYARKYGNCRQVRSALFDCYQLDAVLSSLLFGSCKGIPSHTQRMWNPRSPLE